MTNADWAILIPAVVALMTAIAAVLKAYAVEIAQSHTAGKADAAAQVHDSLQSQITSLEQRVSVQNGHGPGTA